MTNARSITNAVRKALRADNLLARTTTKTQADFRFVTQGGKRVQVPVFRTVIEVGDYAALTRAKLRKAGFDVSASESLVYVIIYTPREVEPITPEVVEAPEQDLTTVTLTELVTRRRAAAEVFRRQERPTDDEIVSAARTIDTVDAELIERDLRHVQDRLVEEGSLLVARDHASRNGRLLDDDQVIALTNATSAIETVLRVDARYALLDSRS